MRSIYSSILLSSLLFTGVATTATRTLTSGSFDLFGSDITSELFAEEQPDFCERGDNQRDGCSSTKAQLLLASAESKPEVDRTTDQMPRGTGRRESLDSGRGSGRLSLKDEGRGSGRRKFTNLDQDSDDSEGNEESHRASGRVEA